METLANWIIIHQAPLGTNCPTDRRPTAHRTFAPYMTPKCGICAAILKKMPPPGKPHSNNKKKSHQEERSSGRMHRDTGAHTEPGTTWEDKVHTRKACR